jgi:hypothetical protein
MGGGFATLTNSVLTSIIKQPADIFATLGQNENLFKPVLKELHNRGLLAQIIRDIKSLNQIFHQTGSIEVLIAEPLLQHTLQMLKQHPEQFKDLLMGLNQNQITELISAIDQCDPDLLDKLVFPNFLTSAQEFIDFCAEHPIADRTKVRIIKCGQDNLIKTSEELNYILVKQSYPARTMLINALLTNTNPPICLKNAQSLAIALSGVGPDTFSYALDKLQNNWSLMQIFSEIQDINLLLQNNDNVNLIISIFADRGYLNSLYRDPDQLLTLLQYLDDTKSQQVLKSIQEHLPDLLNPDTNLKRILKALNKNHTQLHNLNETLHSNTCKMTISYRLDNTAYKIETSLTKLAAIPVLGTIAGLTKTAMGIFQAAAACVSMIAAAPILWSKSGRSIGYHAGRHLFHGLANIIRGVFESVPILGTLSWAYQFKQNPANIKHKTSQTAFMDRGQYGLFFGYSEKIRKDYQLSFVNDDQVETHNPLKKAMMSNGEKFKEDGMYWFGPAKAV